MDEAEQKNKVTNKFSVFSFAVLKRHIFIINVFLQINLVLFWHTMKMSVQRVKGTWQSDFYLWFVIKDLLLLSNWTSFECLQFEFNIKKIFKVEYLRVLKLEINWEEVSRYHIESFLVINVYIKYVYFELPSSHILHFREINFGREKSHAKHDRPSSSDSFDIGQ
jgi:hypothetical protein